MSTKWWYLDLKGQVQGPFEQHMMKQWVAAGHLKESLLVHNPSQTGREFGDVSAFTTLGGHPEFKAKPPPPLPQPQQTPQTRQTSDAKMRNSETHVSAPRIHPSRVQPQLQLRSPSMWSYKANDEGEEHGPYSHKQMTHWLEKRLIPLSTLVRQVHTTDSTDSGTEQPIFRPLGELLKDAQNDLEAPQSQQGDEVMWEYLDDSGKVQGPFSEWTVRQWVSRGWLPVDVQIKRVDTTQWSKSQDVFMQQHKPQPQQQQHMSHDRQQASWPHAQYYYMMSGKEHGPFNAQQMHMWMARGFFNMDLPVRVAGSGRPCVPLFAWRPPPDFVAGGGRGAMPGAALLSGAIFGQGVGPHFGGAPAHVAAASVGMPPRKRTRFGAELRG